MSRMAAAQPATPLPTAPFRLPHQLTERDLLAKYFRTFGNPTRLLILELLRERERSVSELVEQLATSQPYVSNQLACLRWCGLVATRREHRTVYYRVADERVRTMLDVAQSLLGDNAEHVAACAKIDTAA
jgi:DNA-binding transcriptional ArsR family regulator